MVFAPHTPALSELSIDVHGVCMIDQTIEVLVVSSEKPISDATVLFSTGNSQFQRIIDEPDVPLMGEK
jgi:hypothetical protein